MTVPTVQPPTLICASASSAESDDSKTISDEWDLAWEHLAFPITRMSLQDRFDELNATWRENTAFHSSVTAIATDPSYQQIIAMGPPVIPLILRDLEQRSGHWFWALSALTQADPVKPEHRGVVTRMAADWLGWARASGYKW